MNSLTPRQKVDNENLTQQGRSVVFFALILVTIVKTYLALRTRGSSDVVLFAGHLEKIRELGVGVYRARGSFDAPFNFPPPMIHVISFWGWLTDVTGVPFGFWLRVPSILADIGSVFVLSSWLRKLEKPDEWKELLAMVLSPAAILISGYHGNVDSVMIFFILVSLYLVETGKPAWLAGLFFGSALCLKVVPLAFGPVVFFYLKGWNKRVTFFGVAALTFGLFSLPYVVQDPRAVWSTVFGYGSLYGAWGWPLIARLTLSETPRFLYGYFEVQGSHAVVVRILKIATLILVCVSAFWLNRREVRPTLLVQGGLVASVVLFFAPGFGVQYLIWLVPFVVILGVRSAVLYYVTSGLLLAWAYLCISFGLFCSNKPLFLWVSFLCWLTVLGIIVAYVRALRTRSFMES